MLYFAVKPGVFRFLCCWIRISKLPVTPVYSVRESFARM